MSGKKQGGDFRKVFGRGLAILLPSIVTLWLLWQATAFVFDNVAVPINRGVRALILWGAPRLIDESSDVAPDWFVVTAEELDAHKAGVKGDLSDDQRRSTIRAEGLRRWWMERWYAQFAGLLVAVLLIYLAGRLFGNYIGRSIYNRVEKLISSIPGFKQVYPHVKQVVDLIFGDNSAMKAFREVVLVEYPRKGLWSLGLVTGEAFSQIRAVSGSEMLTIFIPTSPTPMTGFVINAPRAETVKMDMSIDQALRWIITAGVLTPDNVAAEVPAARAGGIGALKLARANDLAEAALRGAADQVNGDGPRAGG